MQIEIRVSNVSIKNLTMFVSQKVSIKYLSIQMGTEAWAWAEWRIRDVYPGSQIQIFPSQILDSRSKTFRIPDPFQYF
jgi:hypothetical protein